ncbi:MAG: hypothetical protein EA398_11695 [Deltaproteobacteria bacterium]|nr:MAG: hypothetical protein EA398_11695 [Deltaproteobacteria bacterium]
MTRTACPPAIRLPRWILPTLLAAILLVPACAKPPEGPMGTPVEQNGVSVTLQRASLEYIDLEGPTGAARTQAPVLLLDVLVRNDGEAPVRYDLNWAATQASQGTSALLFVDDGEDKARPPRADNAIPPVTLGAWRYLDDPVTEAVVLQPGDTLEDRILFQRPPAGAASLVLSMPPRIFGSDTRMPAYITFRFAEPAEIPEPPAIGVGEVFENDDFTLRIDGVAVDYIRLNDTTRGEGFSDSPLLRIGYTVRNVSESTLRYLPPRSSSADVPRLTDQDGNALSRASFGPNIVVPGQQRDTRQLAPGEQVEDFLLFERPPRGTDALHLYIVGQRFGSTGLVRAHFPYTWTEPELPPELAEDNDDDDD